MYEYSVNWAKSREKSTKMTPLKINVIKKKKRIIQWMFYISLYHGSKQFARHIQNADQDSVSYRYLCHFSEHDSLPKICLWKS